MYRSLYLLYFFSLTLLFRAQSHGTRQVLCYSDLSVRTDYALQSYPSPDSILQTKSQKKLILSAASKFNTKPKLGLAFAEENGLIYHDLSEGVTKDQSLARFLKSCSRLDKRLLGDFISKPDNIELLRAFIGLFAFKNVGSSLILCTSLF